MKKLSILAFVSIALIGGGCAGSPASIAPVSMTGAYDNMSCDRARAELRYASSQVATLTKKQQSAATGDAIGVFLFLVPVSSAFGGDVSGDLATAKGKKIALENRLRSC